MALRGALATLAVFQACHASSCHSADAIDKCDALASAPASAMSSSSVLLQMKTKRVDVDDVKLAASSVDEKSSRNKARTMQSWREEARAHGGNLFSGCSSVFVDVGANRGTHVRKLFEPEKYPKATYLSLFEEYFGPASRRSKPFSQSGICAFGFEANPRWNSTLQEIEDAYTREGWRVKFFAPMAVSDHDGTISLALNDAEMLNDRSDWGASIVDITHTNKSVDVPAVDFADFLRELRDAHIPGSKLMKMDIEGSEYLVLPKSLKEGLLCTPTVTAMTMEWHAFELPDGVTDESAKLTTDQVRNGTLCRPGEAMKLLEFDDESYLEDGQPLP